MERPRETSVSGPDLAVRLSLPVIALLLLPDVSTGLVAMSEQNIKKKCWCACMRHIHGPTDGNELSDTAFTCRLDSGSSHEHQGGLLTEVARKKN